MGVAAGVAKRIVSCTLRDNAITTYLKSGGTLEKASYMANHSDRRATRLSVRRLDLSRSTRLRRSTCEFRAFDMLVVDARYALCCRD